MLTDEIIKKIEDIVYLAEGCGYTNARIINAGITNDLSVLEEYIKEGQETLQQLDDMLRNLGAKSAGDWLTNTMKLYIKLSRERILLADPQLVRTKN
jgi:hypothetical protein